MGKTTAIRHLISQRPANERWAIVVNEFGALGIDGAILDTAGGLSKGDGGGSSKGDGGVIVREVAGGCLCCAVAAPFTVAVTQLLRRAKPDRLIIEPSGMGHPGGLHDALQDEHLGKVLRIAATIALVDMTQVARGGALVESEAFRDQVQCADVVVGAKGDVATVADQCRFTDWAQALYPPKLAVHVIARGELRLDVLNTPLDTSGGGSVVCKPTPAVSSHGRLAKSWRRHSWQRTNPTAPTRHRDIEAASPRRAARPFASWAAPTRSPRSGCSFTGTTSSSVVAGYRVWVPSRPRRRRWFGSRAWFGSAPRSGWLRRWTRRRPGRCVWTRWRGGGTAGSRSSSTSGGEGSVSSTGRGPTGRRSRGRIASWAGRKRRRRRGRMVRGKMGRGKRGQREGGDRGGGGGGGGRTPGGDRGGGRGGIRKRRSGRFGRRGSFRGRRGARRGATRLGRVHGGDRRRDQTQRPVAEEIPEREENPGPGGRVNGLRRC